MQLTLKGNDGYVDVLLDVSEETIAFLSPVPNIDLKDLMELADTFGYTVLLPITEQQITPDNPIHDETNLSLLEVLQQLLMLSKNVISEY